MAESGNHFRQRRPLVAISRSPGQVAGTTALPPATDIRAPKPAFALVSSAAPPGADAQDGGAVGPEVTLTGRGLLSAISGDLHIFMGLETTA